MPSDPLALLTVPDALDHVEPFLPTGNEFVSVPTLSPRDASIAGMNVLSMRARGLIEFRGEPLIAPRVETDGSPVPFSMAEESWTRLDDWLPQFRWAYGDATLRGTIFAPPGHRGWVYWLEFENGARSQTIRLGLDVAWRETMLTIFSTRALADTRHAAWDRWTRAFVCESASAEGTAAFAIGTDEELDMNRVAARTSVSAYEMSRAFALAAREHASLAFFVAVGVERDGARTAVVDLRRHCAAARIACWLWRKTSASPSRCRTRRCF